MISERCVTSPAGKAVRKGTLSCRQTTSRGSINPHRSSPLPDRICSVCKDRRQRAAVFFPQYCLIGESHVLCAVAHLYIPLDELARRRIVEHFARCRVTRIVNDINLTFAVDVHLLRTLQSRHGDVGLRTGLQIIEEEPLSRIIVSCV